jgi:hypothetical protein
MNIKIVNSWKTTLYAYFAMFYINQLSQSWSMKLVLHGHIFLLCATFTAMQCCRYEGDKNVSKNRKK